MQEKSEVVILTHPVLCSDLPWWAIVFWRGLPSCQKILISPRRHWLIRCWFSSLFGKSQLWERLLLDRELYIWAVCQPVSVEMASLQAEAGNQHTGFHKRKPSIFLFWCPCHLPFFFLIKHRQNAAAGNFLSDWTTIKKMFFFFQ